MSGGDIEKNGATLFSALYSATPLSPQGYFLTVKGGQAH